MEHFRITVAGKTYDVIVEKNEGDVSDNYVAPAPAPVQRAVTPSLRVTVATPPPAPARTVAGAGDVTSPLTGIVQAIAAEVGSVVAEGDLVITLEAMKMYTAISASTAGTIKAIHVNVGDAVEEGQILYSIA